MPKVLPVRLWQARQWHRDTFAGSPEQATRRLPQAQLASRSFVMIASL